MKISYIDTKMQILVALQGSESYSPLMPLPSSWKELRCRPEIPPEPASSRCSLPPLPEEAMLLWGERGAWSGAGPLVVRRSSWDSQTWPRGWLLGPLIGGVRETERFRGLCCWLPPPLVRTKKERHNSIIRKNKLSWELFSLHFQIYRQLKNKTI